MNSKTLSEIKHILAEHMAELRERYHVREIGLFGSWVRGEQREVSDIDILVDFEETPTLLQFINLENYLSDLLGVKVDLVMKRSLKPNIGKRILEEVVML